MILIVGLGNPGKKYELTRHNLGFRVVDEFKKKNNFPDFKFQKIFNTDLSQGQINGQKIILAKPQTYMNKSGETVKKLISNLRFPIFNLWIVHDDIDLPLAKIRISKGRGAAGHKGVESIIKELENKNFVRFRIGIQPKQTHRPVYGTEKFVLKKFTKDEEKIVKDVIEKTVEAIKFSLQSGLEKAMSKPR